MAAVWEMAALKRRDKFAGGILGSAARGGFRRVGDHSSCPHAGISVDLLWRGRLWHVLACTESFELMCCRVLGPSFLIYVLAHHQLFRVLFATPSSVSLPLDCCELQNASFLTVCGCLGLGCCWCSTGSCISGIGPCVTAQFGIIVAHWKHGRMLAAF
jgi:hypothetical protein